MSPAKLWTRELSLSSDQPSYHLIWESPLESWVPNVGEICRTNIAPTSIVLKENHFNLTNKNVLKDHLGAKHVFSLCQVLPAEIRGRHHNMSSVKCQEIWYLKSCIHDNLMFVQRAYNCPHCDHWEAITRTNRKPTRGSIECHNGFLLKIVQFAQHCLVEEIAKYTALITNNYGNLWNPNKEPIRGVSFDHHA